MAAAYVDFRTLIVLHAHLLIAPSDTFGCIAFCSLRHRFRRAQRRSWVERPDMMLTRGLGSNGARICYIVPYCYPVTSVFTVSVS